MHHKLISFGLTGVMFVLGTISLSLSWHTTDVLRYVFLALGLVAWRLSVFMFHETYTGR